jgi:hypothetical protein
VKRPLLRTSALVAPSFLFLFLLFLFAPLFLHRQHLVPFHVLAGDPALEGLDLSADRPDWRTYDLAPVTTFYAEKALAARALRGGELPLWNPFNGLGLPLLADGQSQPFSPFFLPFLAVSSPWVYSFCLLAHLLFGGLGADRLLARLGCTPWARTLGVLAFAFNPYTLKFLAYSNVWGYAFLPWLFLAAERAVTGGLWTGVGLAAAMALAACCGHPEEAFFGACASLIFFMLRCWDGRSRPLPFGGKPIWIPLLAAALSAWWAVPFAEWIILSWSPRAGEFKAYSYGPSALFLAGSEILFFPAMLALAGAGATRHRAALSLLPILVLSVLLLFPFPAPVQGALSLGFMSGRYVRSLAWFILVVWTALGFDRWAGDELGRWKWGGTLLQGAWVGAALVVGGLGGGTEVPLSGEKILSYPAAWVLMGGGLVLWFLPVRSVGIAKRYRAAAMSAVLLGGLLLPPRGGRALWNASEPSLVPAVANENPLDGGRQWFQSPGGFQILSPSLSALWGVRDVRFALPAAPRRLMPLSGELSFGYRGFVPWEPGRLEAAGVSVAWMVGGAPLALSKIASPRPVPRGYWVGRAVQVESSASATTHALEGGAWRETVFLEGVGPEGDPSPPSGDAVPGSTSRPLEDRLNSTSWEVSCPAPGWFVLRDLYWPGWRATVDGRPEPVIPADGAFRAVRVAAGTHRVTFTYRPLSFMAGTVVSALAWGGLLWLWFRRRGGEGREGAVRKSPSDTFALAGPSGRVNLRVPPPASEHDGHLLS